MGGSIFEILPLYHQNGSGREICHWITHIKLSRIIMLTSAVLFIVPLFTHYYLSKVLFFILYVYIYLDKNVICMSDKFKIKNFLFLGGI